MFISKELKRAWMAAGARMALRESYDDPSGGIKKSASILMDIKNKLTDSDGDYTPEQYAKMVAKMYKMMDQLLSRNGEDNVKQVFGDDLKYYYYSNNTPQWLKNAINNGEVSNSLIRKALGKAGAGIGVSSKNNLKNYNKWQRRNKDFWADKG